MITTVMFLLFPVVLRISTAKDATILKYVNSLNAEKQEDLKTILGGGTADIHNVDDTKEPETTVDD